MKSIISFLFCIVALTTTTMAQIPKKHEITPKVIVKVVTEAQFMANPSSFDGVTITIQNVKIAPRKDIRDACRTHPTGYNGIAVVFASAPKWEAVCFSIPEADKTALLASGQTMADITLSGNADKGFKITSYKKL